MVLGPEGKEGTGDEGCREVWEARTTQARVWGHKRACCHTETKLAGYDWSTNWKEKKAACRLALTQNKTVIYLHAVSWEVTYQTWRGSLWEQRETSGLDAGDLSRATA
jgi:hypothetical protein